MEESVAMKEIAGKIDHTLLKPEAVEKDYSKLCEEAKKYHFYSVCVPPAWIKFCRNELSGSSVRLCSVVGFPLGYQDSESKAFEARELVNHGCHEIDMVMNISYLKDRRDLEVTEDIETVMKAIDSTPLKVIIETSLLSEAEKVRACECIVKAGAQFVKTSTGFSTGGATVSDIQLIRKTVGSLMGIKASGGIKNLAFATELIEAGATRLGCSSSVDIINEATE